MADKSYTDQKNQEFFDNWATKYDGFKISPWFQYTQKLAIEQFTLGATSRVLDIGCGTGFAVTYLASVLGVEKACGIDISDKMVAKAQEKVLGEIKQKVEFRQAAADCIPYPSGSFGHVLCTNSFHHYPHPIEALQEMRRVLTPGGELVIFENAPDLSLYTWAWDRLLRIIEKGHVRYYTSHALGKLFKQAGFENPQLRVLRNEFMKYGKLFASIQVWYARKES
ncbi:Methyltransferase type 11 [Nitrosococcus halophilus Nc 4]|uniref:Methyltransferase type 11 n=1 Tax=Nitrosococcus halophilus (strain Nc4) TaxID=472759 RepID=D5C0M4_NITHN|nr:class I SAM-dependent methyltransferase [Nitrosococcus halophilus]ADE16347.1 Methyltransferase type 11 [Nitrosococcus halophilus Nc 4]